MSSNTSLHPYTHAHERINPHSQSLNCVLNSLNVNPSGNLFIPLETAQHQLQSFAIAVWTLPAIRILARKGVAKIDCGCTNMYVRSYLSIKA